MSLAKSPCLQIHVQILQSGSTKNASNETEAILADPSPDRALLQNPAQSKQPPLG